MALTKKQLAKRREGVGASEIASLVGVSKWSTPIKIYEDKVNPQPREESLLMDLGNLLEDPIAKLYAKRTGYSLIKSDTLKHPRHPYALATPDRLVFKESKRPVGAKPDRLLQVKTTGWRSKPLWGPEGTDDVPEDYYLQVQWELDVTDLDIADIAVLFDRDEFRIYHVRRDPEVLGGLHELAEKFFRDHVIPRVPPPPDASEQYRKFLGRLYPEERKDLYVQADATTEAAAVELKVVDARLKELGDLQELRSNEIRSYIGSAEGVSGSFGTITWKKTKDGIAIDYEAAFAEASKGLTPEARSVLLRRFTTPKLGFRKLYKRWAK